MLPGCLPLLVAGALQALDARPDTVYKGKISYIAPTATTTGTIRTYLVRISLDQHDGLLAGMSARVDFVPNK